MTNLTHEDLRAFADAIVRGLDPTIVPPSEIVGLHSEDMAEDGRTLRLYDLTSGRTGMQAFLPGETPGPVRYAD